MQSAGLGASFPAAKRRPARFAEACRPSTLGNSLEERQGARRKALGKTDLEGTLSHINPNRTLNSPKNKPTQIWFLIRESGSPNRKGTPNCVYIYIYVYQWCNDGFDDLQNPPKGSNNMDPLRGQYSISVGSESEKKRTAYSLPARFLSGKSKSKTINRRLHHFMAAFPLCWQLIHWAICTILPTLEKKWIAKERTKHGFRSF